MRKYITLLFIGIFGLTLSCGVIAAPKKKNIYMEEEKSDAWQQADQKIQGCGSAREPIRVGGFVTNPPFGWVNVSENMGNYYYKNDGFSYNLFVKMAEKLKLRTRNVGFPSFSEAILALRKGQIDVLAGSYYDQRVLGVGTQLLFPGYFKNQIIVVFLKGKEKEVRHFSDLQGMRGIVRQEENLYSLIYQQTKGLEIEQVSGARKAYTKLLKGEADYLLTSLYAAEAEARRFKLIDELHFTNYAIIQPELFFIFSTHSPCTQLRPTFTKALEEELKDEKAYYNYFLTFLDAWGNRFRDDPSLIEQIKEPEKAPEELVEPHKEVEIKEEPTTVINISNGTPVPPPAPEEGQ